MNLKIYLKKVELDENYLKKLSPKERLEVIYAAHLQAFPYSNLELRIASHEHPLLRALNYHDFKTAFFKTPGGGYCFQQALLLKEALIQFGFTVDLCSGYALIGAEVNPNPTLRDHLALRVTIENEFYLVDPGLGTLAPPPILITESVSIMVSAYGEMFRLRRLEDWHVLEKQTDAKNWFTIMQMNFLPRTRSEIEFRLKQLEQHPLTIAIRDGKFVLGLTFPGERRCLVWLASTNKLKYTENHETSKTEKFFTDFGEAVALIKDKFNMDITPEELKFYCTLNTKKERLFFNHSPKKSWEVNLPLDKRTLESMKSNLKEERPLPSEKKNELSFFDRKIKNAWDVQFPLEEHRTIRDVP